MVEREAACVEILATRMEEGSLDPAPVWSDARTFDGLAWRGAVDIIAAGYPCQPFSTAGKRKGADDPRHLWPDIKRIIGEVRPGAVVLENVKGHVRLGLSEVLEDLHELGFDAEWGVFSAAQAGAPHRRERLFLVAHRHGFLDKLRRVPGELQRPEGCVQGEGVSQRDASDGCVQGNANPWPLGPDGDWTGVPEECYPATEPDVRGAADGVPGRVDRLRALGNAVCPAQAALALNYLSQNI